ncbi:PDZ and LIM domain protein 2 [Linepithema humile]|uniref:PDZ and LIM domain protein 2 n=1 Tax=Linepithema humile TaxID=83485 RepID=UPI00351E6719
MPSLEIIGPERGRSFISCERNSNASRRHAVMQILKVDQRSRLKARRFVDSNDFINSSELSRQYCYTRVKIATMASTTDIKLSRCNDQSWGFRLSGGLDYTFPLTIVRVTIGGLAHTAGLQAGDVIIKLNGEPISQLTHAQALDKLVSIGNNIVLSVIRSHEIARQQ